MRALVQTPPVPPWCEPFDPSIARRMFFRPISWFLNGASEETSEGKVKSVSPPTGQSWLISEPPHQ